MESKAIIEFLEPTWADIPTLENLPPTESKPWDDEQVFNHIIKNVLKFKDLSNGDEHPVAKALKAEYSNVRDFALASRDELEDMRLEPQDKSLDKKDMRTLQDFKTFFLYLDEFKYLQNADQPSIWQTGTVNRRVFSIYNTSVKQDLLITKKDRCVYYNNDKRIWVDHKGNTYENEPNIDDLSSQNDSISQKNSVSLTNPSDIPPLETVSLQPSL
jgi:hypothetical protein